MGFIYNILQIEISTLFHQIIYLNFNMVFFLIKISKFSNSLIV